MSRGLIVVLAVLLTAGCSAARKPVEQRTTIGPAAREFWESKVFVQNGRKPTFEERVHWENGVDLAISSYLHTHPEAANSLSVTSFRAERRVTVGMDGEQVRILLGSPTSITSDAAEMEKLARRYWPDVRDKATEAWVYAFGWTMYFAEGRLVDMTQYLASD